MTRVFLHQQETIMICKPNGKTAPVAGACIASMPPPVCRVTHDARMPSVRDVVRALGGAAANVLNAFACVAPALASNRAHFACGAAGGTGGDRRVVGIA
ncbi:hypothetical protein WS58_24845 [Burkholderia pseudomultivorans]|nr:hypothetical protein WS55_16425 [Burkholderia pseudomultivorans]KVC27496.1 hypothetical protein WS56_23060 [Burkholderia pseudomultivorans]KVC37128.1 hypothetical protein WS58_24845 [Burkholderia pseudomultivorans]